MAFIQPCFIRKNTPELRKKLEELGYEPCYQMTIHPDVHKNIAVCNFFGSRYYGVSDDEITRPGGIEDAIKNRGMIDCGTNEELFLTLATLRDDSDINQIYLWNERHLVKCIRDCSSTLNIESTPYYMCQLIDNSDIKFEIACKELRKVTVEEIIEHFK